MTYLKEGNPAPDFKGTDQDGKEVALSDFRGRKLVLYFYPKDNTSGCTAEAVNLRDNYETLKKHGLAVLGVSTDDEKSHRKFIEKYELPFPLIADKDKKIVNLYGVWGPKKFMGREYEGTHRVTFVIDEEGKIMKIIDKVKTKDHAKQILEAIENR